MGLENNHVEQEKGVRRPTEILSKVVTGDIIEKMTFGHELEAGEGACHLVMNLKQGVMNLISRETVFPAE